MPSLNTSSINSQADNIAADFATAALTIYSGTPPADANTALSGNVALAVHTLAGFIAAALGVIVANAIADDVIDNSGVATFARLVLATKTMQITVGTSGAELIVNTTTYTAGGTSKINSLTITQPAS